MNVSQRREISPEIVAGLVRSTGSYELVFGAALFAAIGFGLDYLLGTLPLFLVIFAVGGFGFAAWNLRRHYQDRMIIESASRNAKAGR